MAQRDIIVRRVAGARVVPAPIGAPIVIPAVICRTLGKSVSGAIGITRQSGVWIDRLNENIKLPLNEIGDVKYVYQYTAEGKTYTFEYIFKRGIHFRFAKLKDQDTPSVEEYLPFENLYITNIKSENNRVIYGLDWEQAPLLPPTEFEVSLVDESSQPLPQGEYEVRVYSVSLANPLSSGDYWVSQSLTKTIKIEENNKAIFVKWKKVDYVKGYIVEVKQVGDTFKTHVFVYPHNLSAVINATSQLISFTFGAKQLPPQNQEYVLSYKYMEKLVNQPILYSSLEQVKEDHGLGSEAYNVARYFLSTELGNAPFVMIVGVEEDSLAGYLNALKTLENQHCHLIFATLWDMDLFDAMYSHSLSLSDPITGQRERYAVFSVKNDWQWYDKEVKDFLNHFRTMEGKGKRAFLVIFDGSDITLDTWIEQDGSVSVNKKVKDVFGTDITQIFGAMLAFARYCSFRDPASSLTEKIVPGVSFTKASWGDSVYLYLRDLGAFVVRNDFGSAIVDLDINMSYNLLGLNDSQLPVAMTEDWMKQDLRNRLKVFRGKKNIELRIASVIDYIKLILDTYVSAGLITAYDENSIKVTVLSTGHLKGFFKYTPVIIINQVLFEYDFEFIL